MSGSEAPEGAEHLAHDPSQLNSDQHARMAQSLRPARVKVGELRQASESLNSRNIPRIRVRQLRLPSNRNADRFGRSVGAQIRDDSPTRNDAYASGLDDLRSSGARKVRVFLSSGSVVERIEHG